LAVDETAHGHFAESRFIMISRHRHLQRVEKLLRRFPVVGIIGARQVGKSTLARSLAARRKGPTTIFDLEDPVDLSRLEDPGLALRPLRGLVILDEIQRKPELFPLLRVLADRQRPKTRFLVLGSASPELLRQSSESLAGRIYYYTLDGFALDEVRESPLETLWLRGGFPQSFLARSHRQSIDWRRGFTRTFLERDVPALGITISSDTLRRFWTMLAHYHGQIWNASEFARSFGVADTTIRRYLDLLTSTFVVRQLRPWYANVKKRQVKAPKVYITDSGLLHALLNLVTMRDLEVHPKLGASWEGFMLGQVIQRLEAEPEECYFWRAHTGAELDLLVIRGRQKLGFEFKRGEAPKVTRSMRTALADLNLTRLEVVHAGEQTFEMGKKIRALAAERLLDDL